MLLRHEEAIRKDSRATRLDQRPHDYEAAAHDTAQGMMNMRNVTLGGAFIEERCIKIADRTYLGLRTYISRNGTASPSRFGRHYNSKEHNTNYHRKMKYGLTPEQVQSMYGRQAKRCALCRDSLPFSKANVDHNHKTGQIRGLLCHRCNIYISLADDVGIRKIEDYLNGNIRY